MPAATRPSTTRRVSVGALAAPVPDAFKGHLHDTGLARPCHRAGQKGAHGRIYTSTIADFSILRYEGVNRVQADNDTKSARCDPLTVKGKTIMERTMTLVEGTPKCGVAFSARAMAEAGASTPGPT